MEEEISLKELFITLWQGRYIIIVVTAVAILVALAASLIFTTPKYRATASFYLEPHLAGDENRKLEQLVRDEYIPLALAEFADDPRILAEAVSIEQDKGFVEITAAHPDPDVAVEVAEQVRTFFHNQVIEQATIELRAEETSLKSWLDFFDQQFSEHYEDYFITESPHELVADPGYAVLMEERGRRIAMLHEVNHQIWEFESIKEEILEDQYFPAVVSSEPYNIRWQLNTAIAAVLGLMLSVMIVFVKPFADEVAAEIKSPKHDSE